MRIDNPVADLGSSATATAASAPRPADLAFGGGWNDLAEVMRTLFFRASAMGLIPDATSGYEELSESATPGKTALLRLVRGCGDTAAELALGGPVAGARVICVRPSGPAYDQRVLAALEGERGCLTARHSAEAIVALVRNSPRRADDDRALREARRLAGLVARLDPRASVGISPPVADACELPRAMSDASDAATLAMRAGDCPLIAEQCWADITLLRLQREVTSCMTLINPVSRLLEHDRRHQTGFCASVAVWLSCDQDVRRTATRLCIHPNTLRYRLRRASELSGLDLRDLRQRLAATLVLVQQVS